ncbi:MAG: DUF2059 domain-containing protein [Dolichospermum sp.]|jgi:hypothetical protein|nr:DUF2059 domain-containing protein [Dolichospermum circinale Clear-D4]MCE2720645.1 DUF2059 domain-containing protein [Anabaena sp. 49628_E55]
MQIKTFIFAVSLSFLSTVNIPVFAQVRVIPTLPTNKIEDQEKISNIKKLLDITGFKNIARLETIKLRDSFKAKYPQIPAKFLDAFLAELKLEEIVDELIPLYSKYFTNEEIKGIIAFYETPLGKYYLTVSPQISNEAEEIGRKHGIRAMQRALQKLKLEGLKSAGYVTPN